jgi:arginyl-tRNA synthetase
MHETESIPDRVIRVLKAMVQQEFGTDLEEPVKLTPPPDPSLGDFAFGCFPLAKTLRMAPKDIASKLVPCLEEDELFEKVLATGPYLNFRVDRACLAGTTLCAILANPEAYGKSRTHGGTKILVEYSAPNTNKPLHLGHIRNNALGISITNLLAAVGYEVHPVNLINDRGVHICKSMLAYTMFGKDRTPAVAGRKGDHFVGDYYVKYNQEEDRERRAWLESKTAGKEAGEAANAALEEAFLKESKLYARVQGMLRKWEAEDPEVRALWEKMNDWVYEGFQETYDRMGCRFDQVYRESVTYMLGKELVAEGLDQGIFYRKDDGSVWVDLEAEGLDAKLLLRADGTSVYITQDLGTTKLKFDDFGVKRAVWIVGDEQIYHFKVLFAILRRLGLEWAEGCYHLPYGMVDLPEGKMKSRKGTVVDADDLMNELFQMELDEIKSRDIPIPESDLELTAEILAQGALKFFILKFAPKTRMTFNPKESISPEGFTGPYIQYVYVRIQSIFRKSAASGTGPSHQETPDASVLGLLARPEEVAVLCRLADFPGEVRAAAEGLNPSRLCTFLFELARDYNRFYHALPVLAAEDADVRAARLSLSAAVAAVLKQGLRLLGIDMPDRM